MIAVYGRLKEARALLDYDDLILKTLALLRRPDIAPWILFKLDGGIDHILVDEAQDTNPEQWEIIGALCEDFASGESARGEGERLQAAIEKQLEAIARLLVAREL